jgi:hypothetical protein
MPHASRPSRISADIRAQARRYEAEASVGHARRHRRVIAALCVTVVLASASVGGFLARSSYLNELRAGELQFAQVLDSALGVSDTDPARADTTGKRIPSAGSVEVAIARVYEEPLSQAPETNPQAPGSAATVRANRVNFPTLDALSRVAPNPPLWQRNAVSVADAGSAPMIAIVIDDLGLNRSRAYRSIELPAPLTLAFMTYAKGLDRMASAAKAAGHELMLHVPMQPRSDSYNPGPNALDADLPASELVRRLQWGLGRFEGFVGINNHMGSGFTASPEGMAFVMRELRARGLLFLDSLTAASTVGPEAAQHAGVPYAVRDVFLDNDPNNAVAIRAQLAKLEAIAKRRGYAVGIGHPHRVTLKALAQWLPEARRRGFALVPISAIVRHRTGIQAAANTAN